MATFYIAFYEPYLSAYGAIKTNRGELYIGLLATPGPLYSFSYNTNTENTFHRETTLYGGVHRVDRVPGFLSSRPNWIPPPPHSQASVAPPLAWEGVGGPNSDEGMDTLELKVQYNPSTVVPLPKKGIKIRSSSSCLVKAMFLNPILILLPSKARWCHAKLHYNLTLFTTLTLFILFST